MSLSCQRGGFGTTVPRADNCELIPTDFFTSFDGRPPVQVWGKAGGNANSSQLSVGRVTVVTDPSR
jgi:hypothetical protein